MGGYGSGRLAYSNTTSDFRSLDIRRWQREGFLEPGRGFSWRWMRNGETVANIDVRAEAGRVILSYRVRQDGGEWESLEYPVYLDWMGCNYGGKRAWFRCPAQRCGRRVAILYLGGGIFACRHCYRLSYQSQRETDSDRLARRADKIRERLGWEPGILNGKGWKPKGMHWKTFERLTREHDRFTDKAMREMSRELGFHRLAELP